MVHAGCNSLLQFIIVAFKLLAYLVPNLGHKCGWRNFDCMSSERCVHHSYVRSHGRRGGLESCWRRSKSEWPCLLVVWIESPILASISAKFGASLCNICSYIV